MRTRQNLICAVLAVILLLPLTSCNNSSNDLITTEEITETTEEIAETTVETIEASADSTITTAASTEVTPESTTPPAISTNYDLFYESNGDGTCDIVAIQIDPQIEQADIVIPAVSPDGERVIACDISNPMIPSIILKDTFEESSQELYSYVEKGELSNFEYMKFQSFSPCMIKTVQI